jgi:hypothetical protein
MEELNMPGNEKKRSENETLHKALKDTFPASDPVSTNEVDEGVRPKNRKPPLIDEALVDKLAKKVEEKQRKA